MRYHNKASGLDIDFGVLDAEKRRFFETAHEQFRKNVSWFEFEQIVFSYTSPVFSRSKSRAEVVNDPLYRALKDMWLQLGINQGFVDAAKQPEAKTRPARAHRASRRRDVAPAGQPPLPRRRGR